MLARSALGLYWMSRYLERTEHLCRLMATQFRALEDQSVVEIDRNWRRIYQSLAREPVVGHLKYDLDDEEFMLTDSYTLADDLTFETLNSNSIRSCINNARENARQVRHVIGRQLWTRLNENYLELKNVEINQVWSYPQPEKFYVNTEDSIRTLTGIFDSTMYRDHGWQFLQLGRYIERTQTVASTLIAQLQTYPPDQPIAESDWSSLLRVCDAMLAYRRQHSILAFDPSSVLKFLITDANLSHSIRFSMNRIASHLEAVVHKRREPTIVTINQQVDDILLMLDAKWTKESVHNSQVMQTLEQIFCSSRELNDNITSAFFDYGVDSMHSS